MASSTPVCGICEYDNINKPAVVWCSECDEGLCADCKQHHSKAKGTRNHATIHITEYQNLPSHVLEIREYCEEHKEKFQLFCRYHDCPCCRLCVIESHNDCKDLAAIENVIKNVKSSDAFQETEHLITEILDTIAKLRKNRIDNLSSVQQQQKDVERKIFEARAKINNYLDNIQATIIQELADIEKKIAQQTNLVLTSLNEDETKLNDNQATLSNIKQYATDLQAFLSIKQVEHDVASKENSIHKLITTEVMNNTTISCEIDKVVQHLTENIPTLGKVIVQSLPCEITISRKKTKQAQIMVAPTLASAIENITLKLQQTINTQMQNTRGCVLLPDGRMVFSCYDIHRLKSINKDASQEFEIRTGTFTFDITYIESTNTIAVSSCLIGKHSITIIDMRNGKVNTTIPLKFRCDGIVYRDNTLICTAYMKGLRMINLGDNSVSNIITSQMSVCSYITASRDKLYYTNKDTHTVTCCDLQGKTLWQFKDKNILKYPLGITVDNDGNVYVVGKKSSNVVVISSNGQHRRQLLSKDNGLDTPQVLYYEHSTNRLLVSNRRDVTFLYQVTRT